MNKLLTVVILTALAFSGLGVCRPVSAGIPEVRSVVAWNDGGDTKLNVTVYHENGEVPGHYVDNILVVVTSGTPNVSQNFPQSGPHPLDQSTSTFNVTLNFGPLSDAPLTTVRAHCIVHGWGPEWTGTIPEYGLLPLLLTLAGAASALLMMKRRTRGRVTS